MTKVSTIALAACLMGGPAIAQVHDGADNTPSQQRVADEFRDSGSKCAAPACHGSADGLYPPTARPGQGADAPSMSDGVAQPKN